MRKRDVGLGSAAIAIGAVILLLIKLTGLKVQTKTGMGSGFMPLICAAVIIVCGACIIAAALIRKGDDSETKSKLDLVELKRVIVVAACGAFVCITTKYIGLVIALGIVVAVMAKLLGNEKLIKSVILGAGSAASYWLIFEVILKVPLPSGLLGI